MLKKRFLATAVIIAASCPSYSWSQEAWQITATCSVTAPAPDGEPKLTIVSSIRTDSKSADTRSLQIRIQTTDVILKDDEKAAEVTLSIPHQKDVLALTATGSIKGKTNLIVISIPAEAKMLPSFSRGSSAIVKIPTAMGEKQLEVDLKGSGAAVKELASRCG